MSFRPNKLVGPYKHKCTESEHMTKSRPSRRSESATTPAASMPEHVCSMREYQAGVSKSGRWLHLRCRQCVSQVQIVAIIRVGGVSTRCLTMYRHTGPCILLCVSGRL